MEDLFIFFSVIKLISDTPAQSTHSNVLKSYIVHIPLYSRRIVKGAHKIDAHFKDVIKSE